MTTDRWLEEVAGRARQDAPPPMDVAGEVAAQIRGQQPESWDPMLLMAGTAAAAALIITAYALQAWSAVQDPFASLLGSLNPVLQ